MMHPLLDSKVKFEFHMCNCSTFNTEIIRNEYQLIEHLFPELGRAEHMHSNFSPLHRKNRNERLC